jgi:hypothetical protein
MAIATLTIDLVAKLATLERDMGRAAQIAEKNARRMEAAFSAASKALAAIGAAVSVGAFAGMVRSLADAGDQLQKMSARTGETVENLSRLQYAASLADVSNEDLTASLVKLNRVMGDAADGSKDATAALERFGIPPDSGLSAIDAFQQIADRVKATGDETKIASALNDVFGKSFATLIPLLKAGSGEIKSAGDELERMGGVMSGDLAKSSEEFNDNMTRLTKKLDALKMEVLGPLIPLFLEISAAMLGASDKSDGLSKSGSALKTVFETLAVMGAEVAYVMNAVGSEIGGIAAQMAALGRGDFKAFSNIGEALREDAEKARKDVDALTARLLNPQGASGGAAPGSSPGIANSVVNIKLPKGRSEKKETYTDALAPAANAYAKALESISQASINAKKSTLDLNASQEALYDLMTSPAWDDMPDAWKQVAIAQSQAGAEAIKIAENYSRLQTLIQSTDTFKSAQRSLDQELLSKALAADDIDLTVYDEAIAKLNEVTDTGTDAFKQLQSAIDGWGKDAAKAFVDFAITGKSSFSDMANSIIADMARMVIQQNVTGPLAESVGNWASSLFANADGNVYTAPGLSAYSGSIVSSPTVFPFAHGVGLMGEAGPEAIMPLKRGRDGKLGVASSGGSVEVNVINNVRGAQATQTTRQDAGGKTIIDVLIQQVKGAIASDIASGGSVAGAMEGQYGLNRAAGAWR